MNDGIGALFISLINFLNSTELLISDLLISDFTNTLLWKPWPYLVSQAELALLNHMFSKQRAH